MLRSDGDEARGPMSNSDLIVFLLIMIFLVLIAIGIEIVAIRKGQRPTEGR